MNLSKHTRDTFYYYKGSLLRWYLSGMIAFMTAFFRVLKRGGRFLCLELSHVEVPIFKELWVFSPWFSTDLNIQDPWRFSWILSSGQLEILTFLNSPCLVFIFHLPNNMLISYGGKSISAILHLQFLDDRYHTL